MYQNYVAVDWAMSNMAIARMTGTSAQIKVYEGKTDIRELKMYLEQLKGSVSLVIEESTSSQWLYVELRDLVDNLIICDPYRNKLLCEGAKTDKIDAQKLVKLLRSDLLKEVFHTTDELVNLRKIVSAYEDLIKSGVRLKCQRSALYRSVNEDHKKRNKIDGEAENFVLDGLDQQIALYEEERKRYVNKFRALKKTHADIKLLSEIPGLGDIQAVKIVARVVDIRRFPTRNHFWSYSGLVTIDKISGGRVQGKRRPRFCRVMKSVFKTAVLTAYDGENQFAREYERLLLNGVAAHNARNAVARKIASTVYGVLKSKVKYSEAELKM